MAKGYVHVYTGDGKGKTTCILGLALRAVGAGKRVYVGQFLKEDDYSEIKALRQYLPMVTVEQYGSGMGFVVKGNIQEENIIAAKNGYAKAAEALTSGLYDLVILDEINVAIFMGLLSTAEAITLIDGKPEEVELVLTGRYAPEALIESADLVTEMKEVKHYFQKGVVARVGIEK